MIATHKDKLIIQIETPLPDEFVADLRKALIMVLQHQEYNITTELKKIRETNYFILELLKEMG
ncbi:MAG: hypothetical protein ACT4ON_12800 [Bacteroidota bacterium]